VLPKVWTERFQSLGPDLPKAVFKRLQTDMDNFIKREINGFIPQEDDRC
jgi:hypothetical protein